MSTSSKYINQRLTNFFINESFDLRQKQLPQVQKDLFNVKNINTSESKFDSFISHQLMPFIRLNIYFINNKKQQLFIFIFFNIIPNFANAFGLIFPIYQPTIILWPV